MRLALEEAAEALAAGEIPIGAALGAWGQGGMVLLGRAHNRNIALGRRTAHAEMLVFEQARIPPALEAEGAADRLVLATTLEPCIMCYAAAMLSAVSVVLYALPSPADAGIGRVAPVRKPPARVPEVRPGVLAAEARGLLRAWTARHRPGDRHWDFVAGLLAGSSGGS